MGRVVAVAAAIAMLGGCMQTPALDRHRGQTDGRNALATQGTITVQELYAMVKRPTTAFEVLKNLQLAFAHDLLLRRDFYTEENLLRFSGGNKILWRERTQTKQWAWASQFGTMVEPIRSKGRTYESINWEAGRTEKESGKVEGGASLTLVLPNSGITFEEVEQLFGKAWQPYNYSVVLPPHYPYGVAPEQPAPTTHPHGDTRMRYEVDDARVMRSIVIEFHADGTLKTAEFEEETK